MALAAFRAPVDISDGTEVTGDLGFEEPGLLFVLDSSPRGRKHNVAHKKAECNAPMTDFGYTVSSEATRII